MQYKEIRRMAEEIRQYGHFLKRIYSYYVQALENVSDDFITSVIKETIENEGYLSNIAMEKAENGIIVTFWIEKQEDENYVRDYCYTVPYYKMNSTDDFPPDYIMMNIAFEKEEVCFTNVQVGIQFKIPRDFFE